MHFTSANQKNWLTLLYFTQFCFNTQKSTGTNKSPFKIVTDQQLLLPHIMTEPYEGVNLKAHHLTKDQEQNIEVARAYLEKTSKRMKKWANKRH